MKPMNAKDASRFNELYAKKRGLERKIKELYKRMIGHQIGRQEYFNRYLELNESRKIVILQLRELQGR